MSANVPQSPLIEEYKKIQEVQFRRSLTKNRITAIILIISQVHIAIMHGIYIRPLQQSAQSFIIISFIKPFIVAITLVLGFGLLFSYRRRLIFSGIGFTFFIFAYSLQLYPLINAFWTKLEIFDEVPSQDQDTHPFFLSRLSVSPLQNNIEGALDSGIAMAVAFSAVLGRSGLTEAWIVVGLGTFGYEFNRRLCFENFGDDNFGSMYIFAFAGWMGLGMGLILRLKEGKFGRQTAKHTNNSSNVKTVSLSLLGSAILLIGLPFLALDYHRLSENTYLNYTPVLSVILTSTEGVIGSIAITLIAKKGLYTKDLISGMVCGAIAGGSASYFMDSIVLALGIGAFSGILQSSLYHAIENYWNEEHRPITSVSFSLFGIQGLLGGGFAAMAKEIIEQEQNGLVYVPFPYDSIELFYFGLVSSAIGFGVGIVVGFIIFLTSSYCRLGYFNDKYEWRIVVQMGFQNQEEVDGLPQNKAVIRREPQSSIKLSWQSDVSIPY